MVSDRPVRFFVAEKIREQLFMKLGDELPYSCAVEIEKYQDPVPPQQLTRIEAVIYVERDSQKGMVIGKGGSKIKEIGQAAREQIEAFISGKAFLGLRVDVLKDWSKDSEMLKRMGYDLPKAKPAQRRPS
jgi:GTP-binding protein Era